VTHTPPEIWQDINHPRTVKYDVYSFAILLWELITEKELYGKGIICRLQLLSAYTRDRGTMRLCARIILHIITDLLQNWANPA